MRNPQAWWAAASNGIAPFVWDRTFRDRNSYVGQVVGQFSEPGAEGGVPPLEYTTGNLPPGIVLIVRRLVNGDQLQFTLDGGGFTQAGVFSCWCRAEDAAGSGDAITKRWTWTVTG